MAPWQLVYILSLTFMVLFTYLTLNAGMLTMSKYVCAWGHTYIYSYTAIDVHAWRALLAMTGWSDTFTA